VTSTAVPRPPLDPERLATAFVGQPDLSLELLPATPSSNQVAADRAREGAPDGLVVVADHQTVGKGRLDRSWETPAGVAVTFSLVLRPDLQPRDWPWLPLLVGHAVARSLVGMGYDARVKWPNDVLIEGRKVCGILVERVETPDGPAAILGCGLNVLTTADELPVTTATSLLLERPDAPPDRHAVLLRVVAAIRERYDAWRAGGEAGAARLASSYAATCATVGQQVRVELPGGEAITGEAVDVDRDGLLVVATPAGERRVGAGDVVHVRRP
jgi:BirA family transcriptional regulator, biotin operon repressor / biotin---[acetyl-CoA-carboxylase] ligase